MKRPTAVPPVLNHQDVHGYVAFWGAMSRFVARRVLPSVVAVSFLVVLLVVAHQIGGR